MSNIYQETVDLLMQHQNVAVGTVAVLVNPFGFKFVKGIQLYAPGIADDVPNTSSIWIGSSGVTADQALETGGFPLVPGSSITLPAETVKGLYVISAAPGQILTWLGV